MNQLKMICFCFSVILTTTTGGLAESVTYVYDLTGRVIEARYSANRQIKYVYDAAGNLLAKRFESLLDSDSDGMDDAWEQSFFGSLAQSATEDFDSDGFSNLSEFMAGTNPADSNSLLKIAAAKTGEETQIEWQSVPGKRYQLQFRDELVNLQWNNHSSGIVTASGNSTTVTDSAGNPKRFYRVVLVN